MKKIVAFIMVAFMFLLASCADPRGATETLSDQGYTNIDITGYDFFGCSDDDFYHTGFKANSINGNKVSGVVCSGILFKGSTVRTY